MEKDKQIIRRIEVSGVTPSDDCFYFVLENIILKSITPSDTGFIIAYLNLRNKKEEYEEVSRYAEFYFDENGLFIQDDMN